jgi:hypothetical protein
MKPSHAIRIGSAIRLMEYSETVWTSPGAAVRVAATRRYFKHVAMLRISLPENCTRCSCVDVNRSRRVSSSNIRAEQHLQHDGQ